MRWFVYVLSLAGVMASAALGQDAFEQKVREQHEKGAAVFKKATEFAKQGESGKAESELLSILDHDSSPAAKLVVGDALYKSDHSASYKLHKEAYEAEPKEREAILEWAMERHRAEEYAEAIPLYQEYLKQQPDDARMSALLADCFIRVGKLNEAVAAWEAAKHPNNHTGIDFTIYEIYGDLSPATRRGELIKQIRAGKLDLIEKLVDLDLHFDQDWWNGGADRASRSGSRRINPAGKRSNVGSTFRKRKAFRPWRRRSA
jgi:tetratricopeptide (TPR) repeat protein